MTSILTKDDILDCFGAVFYWIYNESGSKSDTGMIVNSRDIFMEVYATAGLRKWMVNFYYTLEDRADEKNYMGSAAIIDADGNAYPISMRECKHKIGGDVKITKYKKDILDIRRMARL